MNTTTNTTTGAPSILAATVPDWGTMSHAAQNIVMYCDNDGDTYHKLTWPLTLQVAKRIRKGLAVTLEHLAGCSTMQKITLVGVRACRAYGLHPTKDDRRAAALLLAANIIDTATDEAANA